MIPKLGRFLSKKGFHLETNGPFIDLVCGMEIIEATRYKIKYKNTVYSFCSDGCKKHFKMDPEKYIG